MNERFVLSKLMIRCDCNTHYKRWKSQYDWCGINIHRYINSKKSRKELIAKEEMYIYD